jgi:hypothetical protein
LVNRQGRYLDMNKTQTDWYVSTLSIGGFEGLRAPLGMMVVPESTVQRDVSIPFKEVCFAMANHEEIRRGIRRTQTDYLQPAFERVTACQPHLMRALVANRLNGVRE